MTGALYWAHGQNSARTTTVFTQRLPRRTRQHRQYKYYADYTLYRSSVIWILAIITSGSKNFVGVLSKRLDESGWLLAREFLSTSHTLCFKEIQGRSEIRVLLSGTFLQSPEFKKCRHSKSSVYRWYTQLDRRRFVYDTLPPTKPPTSYHRFGQELSYK